jgi:hypothetical protein
MSLPPLTTAGGDVYTQQPEMQTSAPMTATCRKNWMRTRIRMMRIRDAGGICARAL